MKNIDESPIFWTRKETAAYLRKTTKTVDRLIRDGKIKAFKFGNRSVLIYANTITEENISSIIPKFNNNL